MERGEADVWANILDRECPAERDATSLAQCRQILESDARAVHMQARNNTAASLVSLRGIIDRFAWTSEPKAVVLISEGLVVDPRSGTRGWVSSERCFASSMRRTATMSSAAFWRESRNSRAVM
ncbi:MAG TPA: hypothetical protein VES67_24070 [Vicinamibacterales bacterium]|nr:hypothetical protein [Vicinamibacterales bacterium]